MSEIEKKYIDAYKSLITKKLQVDGKWKQREFTYLIELIEQASGVKLSLSTIKRIWNDSLAKTPHSSTLDALVSVLDYESWLAFKSNVSLSDQSKPNKKTRLIFALVIVALIISICTIYILDNYSGIQINGDVTFEVEKSVKAGVPNTFVFNYDVSNVEADSFFIQQSWNKDNRIQISPMHNHFTSLYYYPGFHRAKLIANDSIIKKIPIHILTDGWLAAVRYNYYDNIPIYINIDRQMDNLLSISQNDLKEKIDDSRDFSLTYYISKDFGEVSSSDFQLKTRFKNDSIRNYACLIFEIMIMCEVDIFKIRFTSKGCEKYAKVKMGEVVLTGNDHNLFELGTDLYDWQYLELDVQNKEATGRLNRIEVFKIPFSKDFGMIKALSYQFTGIGSINYIELAADSQDRTFYQDDFSIQ